MVHKVIIGIFISILSIFAMSHNASAADFGISFDNYTLVRSNAVPYINCQTNTGNITNVQTCSINSNTSGITKLNVIYLNTTQWNNVEVGDIFEFYVNLHTKENHWIQGGSFGIISAYSTSSTTTELLSVEEVSSTVIPFTDTTYSTNSEFFNLIDGFNINQFSRISKVYRVLIRVIAVPSTPPYTINIGLQARTQNSLFEYYNFGDTPAVDAHLSNFKQYRFAGSEENKEQEEKTQEAVDDSQASGESSQSSVEGTTQSLMSAGASIVSALTSAPATDCNISVNTSGSSRLFTTAIGQLNLCSDVPQGVLTMVQSIVALVFTPIVLYFGYNVITTLYNQFKEYNS